MKTIKTILFFGLFFHSVAHAVEFNVNDTADTDDANAGDGICATGPGRCTLRAAISEANASADSDTINLPAGTYNTATSLSITSAIAITGENTGTTIVDANDSARVFYISTSQPVSMSGFTIQGGNAGTSGHGGGIYINSNGDVTLSAMHINDNKALSGGGIGAGSPINQLTITNSVMENNSGITGGTGPSTSVGGGLSVSGGPVTVTDSTIRGNVADFGGGIFYISSILTLRNTTVSDNTSTVGLNINGGSGGGGIHVGSGSSATLFAINSTISGNKAVTNGAGILIANGTVSLYNTTVTNNLADSDNDGVGYGGGVIAGNHVGGPHIVNFQNSIIAGNMSNTGESPDCNTEFNFPSFNSFGYNIIGNNSTCAFTAAEGDQIGDNIIPIDPMLGPLADYGGPTHTHMLLAGSPAIDAGNPTGCTDDSGTEITTDQRGALRPRDGGTGMVFCDVGAYEQSAYPIADAGKDQVVAFGDTVNLTGVSSRAMAGIASFSWSQIPTETVTLINAATDTSSFVAPSESVVLNFELTVTDNNGLADIDSVTITVNAAPVADAGTDQTVNEGQLVTLDGASSNDSDDSIQAYNWGQTAGSSVPIINADSDTPSFIAPAAPGILSFQLTVTDIHGFTHSDSVDVTINTPPVVNAGEDQTVTVGETVNLNGSASSDSDGNIASYLWVQESGEIVTLNNSNSATPDFVAPSTAGTLSFLLSVTDNNGAVSTGTVTVTVSPTSIQTPDPAPDNPDSNNTQPGNGGSGGGSTGLLFLIVLAGVSVWRRQKGN